MDWSETDFVTTCALSGVEHAVTVALPFQYQRLDAAPLILCLDGAWTAGVVRDATRIMSMSDDAPQAIVAGVSFANDSMREYLRNRARWYTPTPWVPPEETGVTGVEAGECGGALTLLAFLRDQLVPRLEADYRVGERWLVGHSFSGLFGLRVLFAQPDLFAKYLLASPSIWWDGRTILDIEAQYAAGHDDLAASVFLSAGALENDQFGQQYRMGSNVEELVARLGARNHPSLELSHAVLPDESHNSTIGAAISRGLRALTAAVS